MDVKSEKIWNLIQDVKKDLPDKTTWVHYKLFLASPDSYKPALDMHLLDFQDTKLKQIIEDYSRLWDKYTMAGVEVTGMATINGKSTTITYSRCEELIPHKEIEVTTKNIYNLEHNYAVFKTRKPVSLVIRNDEGKYIDISLKSWRDLLRNILKYAYENKRELFNSMVKYKSNYIAKMSKTRLKEDDDKANYTKVGSRYIYINYNPQQLIGVCKDVIEFTGLRHNDFAVKVDWYPPKKSTGKHPMPQTEVVKNVKETMKKTREKTREKACSTEQVQKKKK